MYRLKMKELYTNKSLYLLPVGEDAIKLKTTDSNLFRDFRSFLLFSRHNNNVPEMNSNNHDTLVCERCQKNGVAANLFKWPVYCTLAEICSNNKTQTYKIIIIYTFTYIIYTKRKNASRMRHDLLVSRLLYQQLMLTLQHQGDARVCYHGYSEWH